MRRLAAWTLSLFLAAPAYPWWETGHRVVARLAAAHLTLSARSRAAQLLGVADEAAAVADALAASSTWADETKGETKTGAWHFIDLALQDDKSDIAERCPNGNCVTARIRIFAQQLGPGGVTGGPLGSLSSAPGSPVSHLDALRYVIHFVGDVHQPLHAVSDADLGGNCEAIDPPIETAKNLHALWDGGIVNLINPSDRELAADLERNLESFTLQLRDDLAAGTPEDWTWESHKLAIKNIYHRLALPVEPVIFPHSCPEAPAAISNAVLHISSDYTDDMQPVVREQLTKAGLRLAALLNASL